MHHSATLAQTIHAIAEAASAAQRHKHKHKHKHKRGGRTDDSAANQEN
jgi:hypothetical protein